jgi:hypothetical protein
MTKKQKQTNQALREEHMTKSFDVGCTVSREDLEGLGYDTSKVDDETMKAFVSELGDIYENDLGSTLSYVADSLDIPQHKARKQKA